MVAAMAVTATAAVRNPEYAATVPPVRVRLDRGPATLAAQLTGLYLAMLAIQQGRAAATGTRRTGR
jgi:hypothetical protein